MKRFLASALSLAMILSALLLAGCDNNTETTTGTGNGTQQTTDSSNGTQQTTDSSNGTQSGETTNNSQGGDTQTTDTTDNGNDPIVANDPYKKLPGYENVDFGGYTFVIAGDDGSATGDWDSVREIDTDLSDAVSVKVRERNDLVGALYNCKVELKSCGTPGAYTTANNDVTGNMHTVDIFTCIYQSGGVAKSGNVYNLYEYLDLENEWWDQNWIRDTKVKNSSGEYCVYSVLGDFAITAMETIGVLAFNVDVMNNSEITDDIYELVRTHKWTMDKFQEMITAVRNDANGNSTYDWEEGDIIGWLEYNAPRALTAASGLRTVKNDDGRLFCALGEDMVTWDSVVNKGAELYSMEGVQHGSYSTMPQAIAGGYCLFYTEVLASALENTKDYTELKMGLVPYPLYSETQENYAHYVDNHLMPYAIPVSVAEIEKVAQFFEVYAFHSQIVRNQVIETYAFEYCGNAESSEMLDEYILPTRFYDPGYLWFNVTPEIDNMIKNGTNNIAKMAERKTSTVNDNIATFMDGINDNEL